MKIKIIYAILLLGLFSNCSFQKLTLHFIQPVIDNSLEALFEEEDLQLAQSAIESELKILDGLLKSDPQNRRLLLYATQGYTSYALGFVEDENPERARKLYLRARNLGLRILHKQSAFKNASNQSVDNFISALSAFQKTDVPALFWTANAWGNWINLSLTDPDALADLPKVQAMMERVIELDEGYFFGSAHLFLGTILITKPVIMGGNPEKSKQHFEKCLTFCEDKFLLPYVFYARYYAVRTLDEALFDQLLQKVLETSLDILPEQRLPNAIARKKAQMLMQQKAELF